MYFSNYGLTVIPMFILVGEFVHYGGYNNSLYYATYRWFGHYKGGLAITTIMACAAFFAHARWAVAYEKRLMPSFWASSDTSAW